MKLLVEGQKISSFDSPPVRLVAGSIEFASIELQCSNEWDGLLMTVQFIQKGKTTNVYIGEERSLKVPSEVKAGWLMISCFGAKEDTTVFGTVNGYETEVYPAGLSSTGQEPVPPTPNLYNQLISEIKKYAKQTEASADKVSEAQETSAQAKAIADQIQKNAEDGVYNGRDGEQGPPGIQGPMGPQGEKGETGANGTDGKSAYEIAIEQGYSGTVEEWLESLKASNFKKLDLTEAINLSNLNDGAYQVTVGGYVTAPKNTKFRVEKDGLIFIESRDYGYFNCFIADRKPKLISWIDGDFKEFELQELPSYIQGIDSVIEFITVTLPNEYAEKTEIPTKTSELENDSDYTTQSYVNDIVNSTKTRIVTDTDNSVIPAFELANNTEYRFILELESIEFTLPNNPKDDYISSLVFKSGATATTITYSNTIKWAGEDISSDKFVPASIKTYEILIYWNGFNYCGIVKRW